MKIIGKLWNEIRVNNTPCSHAEWMRENYVNRDGRKFDSDLVPWITAPLGPAWAIDQPQYRVIALQWAARMGKTHVGFSHLMHSISDRPSDAMFATSDETLCRQIFMRFWKILEKSPATTASCPPPRRQSLQNIILKHAIIYGAWASGKSRMADKAIRAGHGNEIDKWSCDRGDTEGDPIQRFLKRGAEFLDHKFILESTPSVTGNSAIEELRLRSTNHSYYIPCPHCGHFQSIDLHEQRERGGIKWDLTLTDPDQAAETAYYECQKCGVHVSDSEKNLAIQYGVWCPDGCTIDDNKAKEHRDNPDAWLEGEPKRDGTHYGSWLPVWYAPFISWKSAVYDYLSKKNDPKQNQQWTNEDASRTWSPTQSRHNWERLAQRATGTHRLLECPDDVGLITIGIDIQGEYLVYVVTGWAKEDTAYLIDYGTFGDFHEATNYLKTQYESPTRAPGRLFMGCVDSGFRTSETYAWCQMLGNNMKPVKGAVQDKPLRASSLHGSEKSMQKARAAKAKMFLWRYSRNHWQTELDKRLTVSRVGHPGGLILPRLEEGPDPEFLKQIVNGGIHTGKRGKIIWDKVDQNSRDDYRDALMNATIARQITTDGKFSQIEQAAIRRLAKNAST